MVFALFQWITQLVTSSSHVNEGIIWKREVVHVSEVICRGNPVFLVELYSRLRPSGCTVTWTSRTSCSIKSSSEDPVSSHAEVKKSIASDRAPKNACRPPCTIKQSESIILIYFAWRLMEYNNDGAILFNSQRSYHPHNWFSQIHIETRCWFIN